MKKRASKKEDVVVAANLTCPTSADVARDLWSVREGIDRLGKVARELGGAAAREVNTAAAEALVIAALEACHHLERVWMDEAGRPIVEEVAAKRHFFPFTENNLPTSAANKQPGRLMREGGLQLAPTVLTSGRIHSQDEEFLRIQIEAFHQRLRRPVPSNDLPEKAWERWAADKSAGTFTELFVEWVRTNYPAHVESVDGHFFRMTVQRQKSLMVANPKDNDPWRAFRQLVRDAVKAKLSPVKKKSR